MFDRDERIVEVYESLRKQYNDGVISVSNVILYLAKLIVDNELHAKDMNNWKCTNCSTKEGVG